MLNKVLKEQKEEDLHIIESDSQGKEESQLFNEQAKINPFDLLIGGDTHDHQENVAETVIPKSSSFRIIQSSHRKVIAIPYSTALTTYFSYGLLFIFAEVRDFFRKIIDWWSASNLQGYAPICLGLEDFYIRRLYL